MVAESSSTGVDSSSSSDSFEDERTSDKAMATVVTLLGFLTASGLSRLRKALANCGGKCEKLLRQQVPSQEMCHFSKSFQISMISFTVEFYPSGVCIRSSI